MVDAEVGTVVIVGGGGDEVLFYAVFVGEEVDEAGGWVGVGEGGEGAEEGVAAVVVGEDVGCGYCEGRWKEGCECLEEKGTGCEEGWHG